MPSPGVVQNRIDKPAANGSNARHARIAQSVEQRIENPRVDGSIPSQATKRIHDLAQLSPVGLFRFWVYVASGTGFCTEKPPAPSEKTRVQRVLCPGSGLCADRSFSTSCFGPGRRWPFHSRCSGFHVKSWCGVKNLKPPIQLTGR